MALAAIVQSEQPQQAALTVQTADSGLSDNNANAVYNQLQSKPSAPTAPTIQVETIAPLATTNQPKAKFKCSQSKLYFAGIARTYC